MKNLIFLSIIALSLCFTESKAQNSYNFLSQYGFTTDTATNTTVKYLTLSSSVPQSRLWQTALVCYSYTEQSGTSAGAATLQWSSDGTIWTNVAPDSSHAQYAAFTHTDVTTEQVYSWQLAPLSSYRLRVKVLGVGTMAGTIKASVVFKNF